MLLTETKIHFFQDTAKLIFPPRKDVSTAHNPFAAIKPDNFQKNRPREDVYGTRSPFVDEAAGA
jgi:hypothetical protein